MNKWFKANGLLLNSEKTYIMNFQSNYKKSAQNNYDYLLSVKVSSNCVKFLEIKVDSTLTTPHGGCGDNIF